MRRFFRHFFTPHHTNNHRAKVLHVDTLFIFAVCLLLVEISLKPLSLSYPDVLGFATDIFVNDLLDYTNGERDKAGLSPLTYNETLSQAAKKKADDMFTKDYWAHFGPNGEKPWDFITDSGYEYTIAGENLAKNFSDSKQVVDAWMASTSHKENILKAGYRDIGFAVVNGVLQGEETTLVVQMFGSSGSRLASAQKPEVADQNVQPNPQQKTSLEIDSAGVFSGVVKRPVIDVTQLTRDITFVITGILLAVLALDGWLVAQRKIIRVAGHNGAHMMFLGILFFMILRSVPGSIL